MKATLFNERMKLADMLLANPNLILLLPRFGIPFGFGDKRVTDICQKYGISTNFFLMICNIYSFGGYLPSKEEILGTDMDTLSTYLMASHKYYLGKRLPHIGEHIKKIAENMDTKIALVLTRFFNDYFEEVTAHFNYEERVVFPYIKRLKENGYDSSCHIESFTKAHTNIEDKLDDLTQIVFKYLPESIIPDEAVGVVFDILRLSEDIKKHSLIEEKIVMPHLEHLEHKRSK